MSRSTRAWMESCARVSAAIGAGERAGLGEQALLGPGLLPGAVSSTKRLLRVLAASMLVIALAPASALAGAASGQHAKPSATQKKQQSAHIRQAGAVVLAPGSGYLSRDGAARVRALQRQLARAGDAPGPIDGRFGPRTEQAVTRVQAARGLQVDGIVGPLTLAALSRPSVVLYPGTGYAGHGAGRVRALQRHLARAGYAPGPIDGRYGPRTEQAVNRFQAAHDLEADGIAGPQTFVHLGNHQLSPHQAVRRSRPAGPHHGANRRSRPGRSRPHTARRPPGRAPAPRKIVPASHPKSSPPLGLLALLIALAVAFALAAVWITRQRRNKRYAGVDAGANRASRSDPGDAIHPKQTAIPNPTNTPNPDPGEPDDADRAFRHAILLEQRGDQIGAMAAYRRADRLGHGAAASNLGVLLEQHGDRAAAEASYRRADQRGEANGAFNVGVLLEERGELAGAVAAYQRADRLGHGAAASNLGVLLEQHGDRAAAEASCRRADQRGDAIGAFNLGVLLEKQGDQIGALRAYHRADQRGHPAIADRARAAAFELTRQIKSPTAAQKGAGHDGP
jgi:peptidoglycan hydrolase-like protein with peptidoglycan-binding domain